MAPRSATTVNIEALAPIVPRARRLRVQTSKRGFSFDLGAAVVARRKSAFSKSSKAALDLVDCGRRQSC